MSKNKVYIPIIISLAVAVGFLLGINLNTGSSTISFQKINPGESKNFNILNEVIGYIESEYVDTVQRQKLVDETVQYLLQELDPHSYYISAKELQAMNEPLEGNFEGIGIQFNIQKDTVVVINPLQGGPSEKVGVKAGDRIIKVEEELIAGNGISNSKVLKLLKGDKGTKVDITVERNAQKLDFTITRDKIPIHSVDVAYMMTGKTGYIKVIRFAKTTYQEFMDAANELKSKGMENLIIDLRGNGGGFLDAAVDMSDELLESGKMIVYTKGRARPKEVYKSGSDNSLTETSLAVLVDESSASASEILAGAVQDNDRGLVIGRRSFGKGLVQEQTMWPDGSATRLTVARYYTPTGRCIQRPYDEGVEAYREEIYDRYKHGEMMHPDSTNFPDSLKYETPEGKTVYGGGGIFPDIFVPYDTAGGSTFLNRLVYRGVVYQWAFDYADTHREQLNGNYESAREFQENFSIGQSLIDDFVNFAKSEGVEPEPGELEESQTEIKHRLKAYVARNIWNNEGFYPIWNKNDNVVNKALESLESGKPLSALRNK
ncbi:MAG: S41 family peptidase [Salibacter sp.]|uniref:S41 family peptidase n=1 Tax=Salibacter sp. TaxID=2010995 RepID=UPI00287023BB|nr:S41 family peptidase [Salibacter sp.]MDR9397496.1 S41 family peptidase [Salibacter sp.]